MTYHGDIFIIKAKFSFYFLLLLAEMGFHRNDYHMNTIKNNNGHN